MRTLDVYFLVCRLNFFDPKIKVNMKEKQEKVDDKVIKN